jgi:hypothetical protein
MDMEMPAARPHGNAVEKVIVSQGTRDMARGRAKFDDLDKRLAEAEAAYAKKEARKRQLEMTLGTLKGRVLGSGWLPQSEYRSVVEQQSELKLQLGDAIAACAQLKHQIQKMRDAKDKRERPTQSSAILSDILAELRAIRARLEAKVARPQLTDAEIAALVARFDAKKWDASD